MNFQIIKSDEILNKIVQNFDEEIYLVGGAVRDLFFDKISNDRDLIVVGIEAKISIYSANNLASSIIGASASIKNNFIA